MLTVDYNKWISGKLTWRDTYMLQKLIQLLIEVNNEKLIQLLYITATSYVEHKKIHTNNK